MATAFETANWLIERFEADGKGITQLQLQKLAFIAHGWHLAYTKNPLVRDEDFKGWKYGPVLESLHKEFKEYGSSPIPCPAYLFDGDGDIYVPRVDGGCMAELRILEYVYTKYGHLSGPQLINVTHRPGSPWYVSTDNGMNTGGVISDQLIREYYEGILSTSQ